MNKRDNKKSVVLFYLTKIKNVYSGFSHLFVSLVKAVSFSIFPIVILLIYPSCTPEVEERSSLTIISWNAYCFFDGSTNGNEYDGFLSKDGYTREKYQERVDKVAKMMALNFSHADIIILEEIESEVVLVDLLEAGLKGRGYLYYGLSKRKEGELSCAFISKFKPTSFSFYGTQSSRLITTIEFEKNGESFTLVSLHLRSQLNIKNEEERREELEIIKTLALERREENLIFIGDFNIDVRKNEMIGDEREGKNFIIPLSGDGSLSYNGRLYCPVLDYERPVDEGTYYYNGEWEMLDYCLLNSNFFDSWGWEYDKASIIAPSECKDYASRPIKYDVSTSSGFSDHFAFSVTLKYN